MELERAEHSVKAARLCLERGYLDSAASRAYFSMFQAAICALESQGIHRTEWSHKAVHASLADILIRRRKVVQAVLAGALPGAMEIRHVADYRQPGPSQRQVQRVVTMAERFIALIKEGILSGQGSST